MVREYNRTGIDAGREEVGRVVDKNSHCGCRGISLEHPAGIGNAQPCYGREHAPVDWRDAKILQGECGCDRLEWSASTAFGHPFRSRRPPKIVGHIERLVDPS